MQVESWTLTTLANRVEIHSTFCRLLFNLDERRLERTADQFTESGIVRMFASLDDRDAGQPVSEAVGHRGIVENFQRYFRRLDRTHHSITNFVADIDGGEAAVRAHLRCYHRGCGQAAGLWEESLALMNAKVIAEGGQWRIQNMDYAVAIILGSIEVFGDAMVA